MSLFCPPFGYLLTSFCPSSDYLFFDGLDSILTSFGVPKKVVIRLSWGEKCDECNVNLTGSVARLKEWVAPANAPDDTFNVLSVTWGLS